MSDWTHGYVTDIEYTAHFYPELAPTLMHFAALSKNVVLPAPESAYTWLEIGCGNGLSANALAASNPQAQFYAFDFNPVHILNAERLAQDAGLKNVQFFDDSFADALKRDLPAMDFIVLHGIYSWVSKENQRLIVQLIHRFLKHGGAVYISYNCLPGWSGKAPLRHLMTQFANRSGGTVTNRVAVARQFVNDLRGMDLKYFSDNPSAVKMVELLQKQDPHYLAHEYLNADWNLFYSSDVVDDLSAAKLTFASAAGLLENADEATMNKDINQRIAQESDPVLQELLKDFAQNRQFRRDIFVKGKRKYGSAELEELAQCTYFTLFIPRAACELNVRSENREISLSEKTYLPILDSLAEGAKSLSMLVETSKLPLANVVNAMVVLSAIGYTHLIDVNPNISSVDCISFNKAVIDRATHGEPLTILAASRLKTAIPVNEISQFFIAAYWSGTNDLSGTVWKIMKKLGKSVVRGGEAIDDELKNMQALNQYELIFTRDTLPLLKTWGVL